VAILNEERTKVLLARKPGEKLLRFVGGFADPRSKSYEADAKREVREETGLEISEPCYIGSTLVDDWRYRGEQDKIKTMMFVAIRIFGTTPKPMDDIAELQWQPIFPGSKSRLNAFLRERMVAEHGPLVMMLSHYLED
jgi:bifunctional NMN adenylyltransferase/nudix hydrolase